MGIFGLWILKHCRIYTNDVTTELLMCSFDHTLNSGELPLFETQHCTSRYELFPVNTLRIITSFFNVFKIRNIFETNRLQF